MSQYKLAKSIGKLFAIFRLSVLYLFYGILAACGGDSGGNPQNSDEATPVTPPPSTQLRSDFNQDQCVGYADYDLLLENFNLDVDASRAHFDSNNDGEIDFSDYSILLQDWGTGCVDFQGVAHAQQFPFVVEITDADNNHLCSGAIVDSLWVLTLAACTNSLDTQEIRIITSRLDTLENVKAAQIHGVEKLAHFPQVTSALENKGLVLIKIDRAFIFSDLIAPISLSSQLAAGDQGFQMVGWGLLPPTVEAVPEPLQYIEFNANANKQCESLPEVSELTSTCIVAKNDSLLLDRVDTGAPVIRLEFIDASQNGLSYRLGGLAVTTHVPYSNSAVVADLTNDDGRIGLWVESTLARTSIYGDIDGDGCIGDLDYQLYLDNNGLTSAEAVPPDADVNADGSVNFEDYAVLLQQWGKGCDVN
ncbi:Trypsin [Alteromonadaceae bacterium Bs31]|nr:Trypsin [Alteromonadaceae bacterium Bs31]